MYVDACCVYILCACMYYIIVRGPPLKINLSTCFINSNPIVKVSVCKLPHYSVFLDHVRD